MKEPKRNSNSTGQDDVIHLGEILIKVVKMAAIFFLLIVSLRFPLLWVKIPLLVAVLFFGWRWLFSVKKKPKNAAISTSPRLPDRGFQAELYNPARAKLEYYEAAVGRAAKPDHQDVIQLLGAYDAAGEFGKAKALILRLNGQEFSPSEGEELRVLAKNYFPIELVPTEEGVRFTLA